MSSTEQLPAPARRRPSRSAASLQCLAGPGEACALARAVDWSQTPIGPVSAWSQALRSTASLVLHNQSPMLLWWGPEFVQIYNDAYRPVLGDKHPQAMGQRFRDCWSEVFHILGPMAERPFHGGPASVSDDIAVLIDRKVPREETHFRLAYSPVPDQSVKSGIGGVLATVAEITEQAYSDRQLRTLRELGARGLAGVQAAEQACTVAAAVLQENPLDVPFALFYLLDENGTQARRVASAGFKAQEIDRIAPAVVDLEAEHDQIAWPLRQVALQRRIEIVTSFPLQWHALPQSPWSESPGSAIVLPLAAPEHTHAYGVLICGISPHRVLDAGYRTFFELTASQVVTAIRDARALEMERKRAEALTAIDQAKTAFFSNVSHEFRTPLTLMLGPVSEVAADPAIPEKARAQLELAHRNALRLLRLVNWLLDFSRIEAGRVQASYEPTDLAELTLDLAATFRSATERAGLDYVIDCLPLAEPAYVDRAMWEKIVLNLISNAFKYTLHGSITVRLCDHDGFAQLEVSDSGVGIAEHELPRIFERFHRVEGTAGRSLEGTGIGLALVQELVKLHGGSITVASELARGTRFCVQIPLGSAHLPADRLKAARPADSIATSAEAFVQEALGWIPESADEADAKPAGVLLDAVPATGQPVSTRSTRPRILLADDNADMRAYIRALLSGTHAVDTVADGEAALAAARQRRPDLIIADIMMPRLDGLALLRAIRADGHLHDVPVILLSARAGEEARVGGLDAGADDYLVKPFSARELVARVSALMELTAMRRKSDERFRALVGAASDAVYAMSADWSEMRFLKGKDFIADTEDPSRSWLDRYIATEDQPQVMAAIEQAIRSKGKFELEHRVRRIDGSLGWTLSRATPMLDESGEIVEWFGIAVDTSGRKQVEEELRDTAAWLAAQKEAFQAAVNGAPLEVSLDILTRAAAEQAEGRMRCAFFIANAEQTSLRHVTGMPEDYARNVDGFPIGADSISCGLAAYIRRPVINADVDQDPLWKEWLWLTQRHHIRACWSFPVETSTGKVVGTFAMYHEQPCEPTPRDRELATRLAHSAAIIISRHQEAEERARAAEALRAADRQKDEFLAMLAHELRNPLAPICIASELLSQMVDEEAEAQRPIAMIKRQACHLTALVDDLLDVSRITQGRIVLQRGPIELASIVAQAIETVEARLREKRHKLAVVAANGYEPVYVNGDLARLVQCLSNILTNAAKYTQAGGEIRVQTRIESGNAIVEVTDNGAGIAAELLPHVFDLFVQSERTLDRSQGGLGIGLAVVKRLVEMHEGSVSARSAGLGQGSTFEIRLPRTARPAIPAAGLARAQMQCRRVLIVDDNVDAANSLLMLLRLQGHTLEVAYSGQEALECVAAFEPEVILLDIGLPGMNGYEVASKVRALPGLQDARLVALTGYGQAEDRQRALAAGFDDHLVKPVDLRALDRTFAASAQQGEVRRRS